MSLYCGPATAGPGAHRAETLPLTGIRFLEVGEDFACAYAGHLLSLLGADVVRVPAPAKGRLPGPFSGGGHGRGPHPDPVGNLAPSQSGGLDAGKALFTGETAEETLSGLPFAAAVDPTGTLRSASFPVVRVAPCPTPAPACRSPG